MGAGRFSVEAIFSAVDRMSAPIAKMSSRIDRMTRGASRSLAQVDQAFGRTHAGIMRVGASMTAAGAIAGVAGRAVVAAGMDFEHAISELGAVGLKTRSQIADLEAQALSLGRSTAFSSTEVANAMSEMSKAGFSNQEIMSGIPGVLDAAAASGLEIASVAEMVAGTLRGMGLEAHDAGRVADVLALAGVRTKSSLGSLSESMEKVSATARTLGIPLEQVVASVGLLQDRGIDASTAGTAMSTMLTQLATPSKQVAAMMRKLGLSVASFKDADGNMLPLEQVLGKLSAASAKAGGNFDRVAFFTRLVGTEGLKAALNLSELADTGKLQALTSELEKAQGVTAKMALLRQDDLQGDWEKLTGTVDGLSQSLFKMQSGPLRGLVQGWAQWIEVHDEQIIAGASRFFAETGRNLPTIIAWLERGGTALAVFYTASGAVKTARLAVDTFDLAQKSARGLGSALVWSAGKMQLLNLEAGGLRNGLNASALGTSINSVTSKLGKAGLLGAAALVGYELGEWLNTTFALDKKLADLASSLTGLDDEINQFGAGTNKRGIQGSERMYADGSVVDQYGLKSPATGPFTHASPALPAFLPPSPGFDVEREAAQVVTPGAVNTQELAAAIGAEVKQSLEVSVSAEPGTKAEVKGERKSGRSRLSVPASGRKLSR